MGQIIESAEKTGRTVFLNGRGIMENVNLGQELGLLRCNPNSTKLLTSKIDSLPENNQIILTTGSQGEEGSGLYRMAHGDHPIVKIQPGDTIILSSTSTSGNERSLADIMNVLIQSDATLFTKDGMTIDKDKHASGEEQKILLNLIRPRNFMPVHGELFMRVAHKKTAMAVNILDKNIFLANNGSILDIDQKGVVLKQSFKLLLDEIIVDGYSIGVATSHVIEARAQMMKAWVVTVVFKADEKTGMLLGHLKLETRGLVYLDEVREVHKMIIKRARASYEDTLKDIPDIEEKDLIKIIRRDLETFLLHKIERNPMIIPMIISI
ncbi:MAG: Metal-dependent hydrolase [uncultured bacterium (gcode 4)]|uniref:Metal-dependent hydrolase n=1 Tax=uncultured bacterium (gcode 4) TaxID=1234023 RepID=K1YY57_9BACT|nr:MAG: Metal-dependent hydrolase [uncultured bacterium (gcode 4)]